MPSKNFIVSSLPAYVQDNRDLLIKNFALVGGATRPRMSLQTGVKEKAHINYLEIVPELQDGSDCGFTAQGSAELTQREIECPSIKVDMEICPRKLIGKYAEYLVRNNATENDLPFEQYIMQAITDEINKRIEKLIWQGDKTKAADAAIKWFNGLLKIAGDEASVVDVTIGGTSVFDDIDKVVAAIPEEALERNPEVYLSPAKFNSYLMEVRNKNFFHYSGAVNETPTEFIHPGTGVKVVKTPGLSGKTEIVATFPANLVYGCDMENDSETIDLWWSQDDRVFKIEVLWNSGVQIAFPNMVVLGATA